MIERYTRPEMGALWTDDARLDAWLEVELAVCEAWRKLGVIPEDSMAHICRTAKVDPARVREIELITRHDVIAFLTALEEKVGPDSRFIHLGCTSSDIVDTANAMLLTRAGRKILAGLDGLLESIKKRAYEGRGMLCMGRTHGVHAEPTSFGLKMSGFYAEFTRHRERFAQALEGIAYGKISGAVGTYAQIHPELEEISLNILGLKVEPASTQVVPRDRYAHYFTALALFAGGVERLCVELRHLQRTEVLEAEEGFAKGQKGSSAMPHKKNPISAENMAGLSRLLRTNALAAMENMPLWHERDISHSSVERVIMPDSTILADYILHRLKNLLENLRLLPENMLRNLMGSYGLFFSQRVLLALVEKARMTRQEAYALVQASAMKSWEERRSFEELVRADRGISSRLEAADLNEIFDLKYYLRHEGTVFARVYAKKTCAHEEYARNGRKRA